MDGAAFLLFFSGPFVSSPDDSIKVSKPRWPYYDGEAFSVARGHQNLSVQLGPGQEKRLKSGHRLRASSFATSLGKSAHGKKLVRRVFCVCFFLGGVWSDLAVCPLHGTKIRKPFEKVLP